MIGMETLYICRVTDICYSKHLNLNIIASAPQWGRAVFCLLSCAYSASDICKRLIVRTLHFI